MDANQRAPAAPDTAQHRALSSASRAAILELIRARASGLTAAEVARYCGLHRSTVRAHLERLTAAGLVTREPTRGGTPGRPAWRYRAVAIPRPADSLYRDLAGALVGHLARADANPASAGEQAGRDWGRRLVGRDITRDAGAGASREAPLDGLVRVLDHLGFTPTVVHRGPGPAAVVHLRSCPFLDLVGANQDVVCGLHLGVIRGALGGLGASTAGTTLEPFGAEGACVVRVASPNSTDPALPGPTPAGPTAAGPTAAGPTAAGPLETVPVAVRSERGAASGRRRATSTRGRGR